MLARCVAAACLIAGCEGGEPYVPLAWGVGVTKLDAVGLGLAAPGAAPDPFAAAITPELHLVIPTYDGSGQAVHPDVLREADRLLMAITPYAYSNGRLENPSLLVTEDGMSFADGPAANPLVPAPQLDHNDDPDIHVDPATGEYEILFLETLRPDTQYVSSLRSRDLVTWSRTAPITYDLAHGAPFIVSPAALVHDGATSMFDVHLTEDSGFIERIDSPDGRTWDATTALPIALDMQGITPWHVDALATPTGYALLINGYTDDFSAQDLYLATSPDLATWTLRAEPLLAFDDAALDLTTLYRSTGFVAGDQLVIWYSHQYHE